MTEGSKKIDIALMTKGRDNEIRRELIAMKNGRMLTVPEGYTWGEWNKEVDALVSALIESWCGYPGEYWIIEDYATEIYNGAGDKKKEDAAEKKMKERMEEYWEGLEHSFVILKKYFKGMI